MSTRPAASTPEIRLRMQTQKRSGTTPELALRRAAFALGLRYRLHATLPVKGLSRRRADLVFSRARVAVFVDGCFWHGCSEHGTEPRRNGQWWRDKIARNKARDEETDSLLGE